MTHIFLSQSKINSLGLFIINGQLEEEREVCPLSIYKFSFSDHEWESENTNLGKYGETLVLGSCARGEVMNDPPLMKNGKKSVKIKRIEEHASLFNKRITTLGANVIIGLNTQVKLIKRYSDNVWITMEYDIFPTTIISDGCYVPAIIDVKYSSSSRNDYFSHKNIGQTAPYCFGDLDMLSRNQQYIYQWGAQDINIEYLKRWNPDDADRYDSLLSPELISMLNKTPPHFCWFVMGHEKYVNPDDALNIIKVPPPKDWRLLHYLIDTAVERYVQYENEGWKPNPSPTTCGRCKIKCELDYYKNYDKL